jgi:hypothetical protein
MCRVSVRTLDLLRSILSSLSASTFHVVSWSGALAWGKAFVRLLARHTGLPALLVAAVLVIIGYRLLKRTARFAIEVAAVMLVLVVASELGWIRW